MMRRILITAVIAFAACSCAQKPVQLGGVASRLQKVSAGDTIFVADGVYEDVDLVWKASAPAVVAAANPGKVVVIGRSSLHISGTGLEISGLVFRGCVADRGSVVEFRNGDEMAEGCRLTECVIDRCVPARRDISYSYVHLYGRGNRVDHCSFLGKLNLGVTLIVMLNYPDCDENNHSIDHNWFGPRPVYGSNGAETIRVGTSQQCMQNSRTLISENFFDRCNGEVEVVSIKSSENCIKNNVFYECQGVLALRHGDRNTAEGNLFIGHGIRNTGGIRVVGEDQVLRSNTMLGLAGERFFSALALMYAVPNSLPNRYMQVKDTVIEHNVFEACKSIEFTTGQDYERTLPPVGTVWEDNRVDAVQTTAEPSYDELLAGRGASWYVPECSDVLQAGVLAAAPGDDLPAIAENAVPGSVIELSDGLYALEKSIRVSVPLEIRAAEGASPRMVFRGRKRDNFITIADGGSLRLKGIAFSGELTSGRSLAEGIVSTAKDMIEPYNLSIEDCSFEQCGESGFIPVKGMKGTFADSVVIRRCHFEALSGDAVNYAGETEDKGRYNADDIIMEDCTFERILGIPVNIYRGGSDESTAGPYVTVSGCTFDDCCNKVRGSVIRITGAQILSITGNSFLSSGRGGYSIRLDDAPWEKITLGHNTFVNSGKILSNR